LLGNGRGQVVSTRKAGVIASVVPLLDDAQPPRLSSEPARLQSTMAFPIEALRWKFILSVSRWPGF